MTKLRINERCSVRTEGVLYCLSDLYHFMDMRNLRAAPQHWATDRAGITLVKKGFLRKTFWGRATILISYAESLTPGIAKEVRKALGMQDAPVEDWNNVFGTGVSRGFERVMARPRARPQPATRGVRSSRSLQDDMAVHAAALSSVSDSSHDWGSVSSSRHSGHDYSPSDFGGGDFGGGGCD